jgi:ABC-type nitrate/sulfonate/bicarbonate transport system substrate-binding protein
MLGAGCSSKPSPTKPAGKTSGGKPSKKPAFSLAWSEYPSWSVFGVAHEKKLIDGAEGKLGPIEEKWGVDIVLKERAYDPCIQEYSASSSDAVCITNMDVLAPALTRESVAILPTSTSVGADACIVVGIDVSDKQKAVQELRKHKVYGLAKSVSEYAFVRNLELMGEKESDHQFTDMPPDAAALALQTKRQGYDAVMVWNPFVLQTLKSNPEAKVIFSSDSIPEEIIDMVVVARQSLEKPGGKDFACAVIDAYYQFNQKLADASQRNELLVALGAKFSNLSAEEMEQAVEQTRFYKTPEEGLNLFTGEQFPKTMKTVVDFCVSHKIVEKEPKIGFGGSGSGEQLRFDPSFIQIVRDRKE